MKTTRYIMKKKGEDLESAMLAYLQPNTEGGFGWEAQSEAFDEIQEYEKEVPDEKGNFEIVKCTFETVK